MIISVDELKKHIATSKDVQVLQDELEALEVKIRAYTNNNFQNRNIRFMVNASNSKLNLSTNLLKVNDTIEISQSKYNDGVYVIKSVEDGETTLDKELIDEQNLLITKVVYPLDVRQGVIDMMKWDLNRKDKVGVQSETISRHSVSYSDTNGENSIIGYPKILVGFLKNYMKARF